jgi:hypothetical protein
MKRFGWKQWAVAAALALVVLLTGFFGVRTVRRAIYWGFHRDEAIRPWMSIPYVAHSHRVPPRVLYEALGVTPQPHDRRPLKEIARQQNRSVEQLTTTLQDAIARERARPTSGSPPPAPGRSP